MSKSRSLEEYQALINKFAHERGFNQETIPEKFMLLLEEAGEFAKAARKVSGIKADKNSQKFILEAEAADVFWLLIDLCNSLSIKLEEAFQAKEEINRKRTWN